MMTTDKQSPRITPLAIDERRQQRRQVNISVRITEASAIRSCGYMTDISEFGCRISNERRAVVGRLVSIDVPDFTTFTGWVVWSSVDAMGIDFSNPLRTEVVDHLERISAGTVERP